MNRLQLTTTKGHVFLSPFVYGNNLAKKKLNDLSWLVKEKAKIETIEVKEYPKMAVYGKDRRRLSLIKIIEKEWKKMEGDQDDN